MNLFPTSRATTWDGNGSARMHHLMKALQSSRLLEVACQPRFPSLKTMLLTKCPSLGWGNTAMSSSLQDPTPSRAGCRPRWSREPTYSFLGLALPQHLNKGRAPKRKQPSLFKKALLGRRCLLTLLTRTMQCSEHESVQFRPLLPC